MNLLDMRTVVFSYVVTDIICVWFIVLLWRQSRDRFAGTAFLVFDFIFQAAALVLIVLRGAIPDWMSMVLSNTLVIAGAILGFQGLERFVGRRGPQIHNYLLVTLFVLVHGYFTSLQPNLAVRNLNIAAALLLVCFQSVWLLFHRVDLGMRRLTFGVGMVFGAYCLVSVIRIVEFFVGPHLATDYFQSGTFEALVLVAYQMLFMLLTYSLVLMVNKRLLMEIGTQEEKFSKAFHSSPYAVSLTKLSDGHIFEVNKGFENISGYAYAEVIGKNTPELRLWAREEDRLTAVNELSKSGKIQEAEFQFRKKSGEIVTGLFSADTITIDNRKCVLSSICDITGRKRAEEEIRRSRDDLEMRVRERTAQLERSNQDLQAFAFIAAHDLQEPLRKVITFGKLLKENQNEALGEEGEDYLRRMVSATERMRSLLDSLLDYSRVSTKAVPLTKVNLTALIREVLSDLEMTIQQTGGEVQVEDLPEVTADPIQMSQLLQNLIGNALKFRREGGKPLVRVRSAAATDSETLQIVVEDNGIGFDESYMDKIFKPFQRLHGRTSPYEGMGMGLAICRRIVERHGGSITASSKPGEGSTFIVNLPKKQ